MKKLWKVLLLVGVLALVSTGCTKSTEEKTTETPTETTETETTETETTETETEATDSMTKDTLVMGLDDTFAPMGFRDKESGELVGFDIDMANAVSQKIGKEIKFQPIDWTMKENELNAGNIDMIWNGYSVTELRKEQVLFSEPYLKNRQIILVLADSPVKTKADLEGKVVSVQAMSSAITAVTENDPEFLEIIKDGKMIEFSTNEEAFNDLEAKRSDAVVADETTARYYMHEKGEEKYRVLEENFGEEDFAVGFRKGDEKLKEAVDNAIEELRKDGQYEEFYSKWFSNN